MVSAIGYHDAMICVELTHVIDRLFYTAINTYIIPSPPVNVSEDGIPELTLMMRTVDYFTNHIETGLTVHQIRLCLLYSV